MNKTKTIATKLLLSFFVLLMPLLALAGEPIKCGDNVTLTIENDVATFSGTGPMYDYVYIWSIGEKSPLGGNSDLRKVIIEEGITTVGAHIFANCENLVYVSIPEGVTKIGQGAFVACRRLTSIILPKSLKKIDEGAFSNCNDITTIVIPEGVTEIGDWPFEFCYKLESITLPSTLKSVGRKLFDQGTFTQASNPCIYCYAEIPPTTVDDSFVNSHSQRVRLYVPAKSIDSYKNSAWDYHRISSIEEALSIEQPTMDNGEVKIYNLMGHEVKQAESLKGIHIVNGKKVIFK